ncbi:MAG: hypothetical protein M3552_08775 [Planctomycetota bacterium]|nr:hypothetical protein [Planctomycetaceae bacterium]MDQ3330734.1 hypothetical protein [Planctomycetota bacterium]
MNRTDDMIRRALAADEFPRSEELPITEQILETFRGRNRWIAMYVWVYTFVVAALTGYSIYRFANATDVTQTVSWGIGIMVFGLLVAMGKIWYWMELNKNAVTRELKRVELQLAELQQRLGT